MSDGAKSMAGVSPSAWPRVDVPGVDRELGHERIRSARSIDLLRLSGVSAFFALFLVLGALLRWPGWTGNLQLFALYWLVSVAVLWVSRRFERWAPTTVLALAIVDVPMVFLVQHATLANSASPSGVAGFTVGVYVLLVILSAFSLRSWYIAVTATAGAAFELMLQHLAGVGVGGMVSTVIVLALAAAASIRGQRRLVELAERVEAGEHERSSRALRRAEHLASIGTLAACVAHEINTPLTYVVTNLALLAERLAADGGHAPGERAADQALDKAVRDVDAINGRLVAAFKGRLSGELRHEFNNIQMLMMHAIRQAGVEVARLNARSDADAPPAGAEVQALLGQAREGAERVRGIVRDLRTFAWPGDDRPAALDVSAALASAINLTASEIHQRARLRTDLGPVPKVMATEARLGQVFVNLLLNAARALPDGSAEHNEIRVTTRTDGAGRAIVEVSDTGAGIAPEHLGQLFEPFFTTRPAGRGSGLGLSISHGIVTALGGELSVESAPGRGSIFRVTLPAATHGERPAPAIGLSSVTAATAPSSANPATAPSAATAGPAPSSGTTGPAPSAATAGTAPSSGITATARSSSATTVADAPSTARRGARRRRAATAAARSSTGAPDAASIEAPSVAGARVLIVDDDAGIGEIVRQSLAPDHEVEVATSGLEALELLSTTGDFDVIFCDLMMPAMTGIELHGEVARRFPAQAARMVFMTGGAFTPRAEAFLATTTNPRIDKPFTPADLRSAVARATSAPS